MRLGSEIDVKRRSSPPMNISGSSTIPQCKLQCSLLLHELIDLLSIILSLLDKSTNIEKILKYRRNKKVKVSTNVGPLTQPFLLRVPNRPISKRNPTARRHRGSSCHRTPLPPLTHHSSCRSLGLARFCSPSAIASFA